ncbi:MAG: succinylglutamate desuccinylase/aspartoacylase family protein [Rhodospirillales bacterium]|nr:MAG: succinylglutamate desuccinylase/aspartoacylase family protein [Rhodospirillales bacterium]
MHARREARPRRAPFEIGDDAVPAGGRATVDLPISLLSTHTPMALPVHVVHGRRDGPTLFVSAAVHGDEIIGIEVIRRLLRLSTLRKTRGTLLCIPVVNVFGLISHSRYLPDRRDLNRSFPGSATGSLAGQLAHVFLKEIVSRSDCGIDIHSAAIHRCNLPQIRISPDQPRAMELAEAFNPPAIITAPLRDGSLRRAASNVGVDVLLYEAGEALRFDEVAVRVGVKGILRVMQHLGMIRSSKATPSKVMPVRSSSTYWVRAPQGGIVRSVKALGSRVDVGDTIGYVADPLGQSEAPIEARKAGIVIGLANMPVVNRGDALCHIAEPTTLRTAQQRIEQLETEILEDPLFDEDEII